MISRLQTENQFSGSVKMGDSAGDTHIVSGSIDINGSIFSDSQITSSYQLVNNDLEVGGNTYSNTLTINGSSSIDADLNVSVRSIVWPAHPYTDPGFSGPYITRNIDSNNEGYGGLLYMNSTGSFNESDATTTGSMPALGVSVEVGIGSRSVALPGAYIRNDTWTWTPGGLLYATTATGSMSHIPPTGTGNAVQVIGIAVAANVIYFNPQFHLIVHK